MYKKDIKRYGIPASLCLALVAVFVFSYLSNTDIRNDLDEERVNAIAIILGSVLGVVLVSIGISFVRKKKRKII